MNHNHEAMRGEAHGGPVLLDILAISDAPGSVNAGPTIAAGPTINAGPTIAADPTIAAHGRAC